MFEELKLRQRSVNFMLIGGGIGDAIAAMVPVRYAMEKYPQMRPIIWVPDPLHELTTNLFPEGTEVRMHSEVKVDRYQDNDGTLRHTSWDLKTSPMKISLVDYGSLKLIDELLPAGAARNSMSLKREVVSLARHHLPPPQKYVVVATGHTASVRAFPPPEANKVVKFIKERSYGVVFLGNVATPISANPKSYTIQAHFDKGIDFKQGTNLIDQTTLLEAAAIMHDAAAVVGVDGGLIHLAGCTKTPIICGFTTVRSELRWPTRDGILGKDCYEVVPDESLNCRFCQSDSNFLYEHDYRNCKWEFHPGYEDRIKACVKQLKAEKFIRHLDGILQ